MTHQLRSRRVLGPTILVAITSMVLAGCGSEADLGAASVTSGTQAPAETIEPTVPEEPIEEDPTTDPAPSTEPVKDEPSPTPAGGAQCLIGNWFVDNAQFEELMSIYSGGAVGDIAGSVMVTFREDGTTTTQYDEWTHSMSQEGVTATVVRNGADSGTYEVAADGSMTMNETDLQSTTEIHVNNGISHTAPPRASVFTEATFTCSGDELTVAAQGSETVLQREH